ncbi:Zinc finger A20 and AN1 domain-containing stress-associated protein 4, partial [Mucuna pruriens]
MAEEHRCETPEGHRLCANNCGLFGSSATMNLCSKCYSAICLKEQEEASTKSTIETALSSSPSLSTSSLSLSTVDAVEALSPAEIAVAVTVTVAAASSSLSPGTVSALAQPNRCATCRKRVGLTGFKCRCGVTFCGTHRYPEKHACGFDFKTVGREEIARANPVIKAEKLRKI